MFIDKLFGLEPFDYAQPQKEQLLCEIINELTQYHYKASKEYEKILNTVFHYDQNLSYTLEDIPFISVRLFKEIELKSTNEIFKTMTSSGTTSLVSKIFLDKTTALNQSKVLAKIITSIIGKKRLPMIVLDTSAILKDRMQFSARGSGILGFSIFARDRIFALDENMQLQTKAIQEFLEKYPNQPILLFGFTFMVWEFFYKQLKEKIDLSQGILFHGGGWKKLINEAVSNEVFKNKLKEKLGITQVYNYYGMVEQTGSIFVECNNGHLHSSIYSDIIIRDKNFNVAKNGEEGLIQLISTIPTSYPGHNILSEDLGVILGIDDCGCGMGGKYFRINGRIKKAEMRGCSDTFR